LGPIDCRRGGIIRTVVGIVSVTGGVQLRQIVLQTHREPEVCADLVQVGSYGALGNAELALQMVRPRGPVECPGSRQSSNDAFAASGCVGDSAQIGSGEPHRPRLSGAARVNRMRAL
jgi:hypothetical protein